MKETLDALVRMVPLTHYPRIGLLVYADRRPGTASADPVAAVRALRSHAAFSSGTYSRRMTSDVKSGALRSVRHAGISDSGRGTAPHRR